MSAIPNSHDSQYKMPNGLIKKDGVYVRIRKDIVKGAIRPHSHGLT